MGFLSINKEVKCAFRWYDNEGLRNRNLRRCADCMATDAPETIWAINSLTTSFPPFQIRAADAAQVGFSTPTSWKVYDLSGTLLLDLATDLDKLEVVEFSGPSREYIVYNGATLSQALPANTLMESVIECVGGASLTRYSETVRTLCLGDGVSLENTEFTDGTENWEYGAWDGLIVDVDPDPGPPSYGTPEVGDQVVNTGDNKLYVWNGTVWVDTPYSLGDFYSESTIGGDWYVNNGAGWVISAGPFPVTILPDPSLLACWNGTGDVALDYFPDGADFPGQFTLTFTFFFGGGITGQVQIYQGATLLTTIDDSVNGQPVEVSVIITGDDPIHFVPSGGFEACMTVFTAVQQVPSNCRYMIEYYNCGDLGTQYYRGGWKNRIYLDNESFMEPPVPQLTNEVDEAANGDNVELFRRKQVEYGLRLAGRSSKRNGVPWWFLDAITEIPEHDTVTLTDMSISGTDTIYNITIDAPWAGTQTCLTSGCLMTFQASDDATVNAGCCEEFLPPCASSCADVSGFYGTAEPILGEFYLLEGSEEVAQYLGFDNGPVDVNGYDVPFDCESGIANGINGFLSQYWTGTEWAVLSTINFEYADFACGELIITGIGHPRYDLRLQYSLDGSTWLNFDPDITFGYNEIESPTTVNVGNVSTPGTMYIRLQVFGPEDCTIGTSNVCQVFCQSMIVESLGSNEGWIYASGGASVWTDVDTFADLAGLTPDPGDIALVEDENTFYFYDGDSWELCSLFDEVAVPPPVYHNTLPDRMCTTLEFDAIQGSLSSPVDTGTTYQLQIQVTGGLFGRMHFPGTFDYVIFDGPGYYTGNSIPAAPTSQIYIDFLPGTEDGCITNISVRPLCEV